MLTKLFKLYSNNARRKRAKIFHKYIKITESTTILDLGGADGQLIDSTVKFKNNITVADIDKVQLKIAKEKFGFKIMELDESGVLPFKKNDYDVIFCTSVIEHVTVDKNDIYKFDTNKSFKEAAFKRQKLFADEIRAKSDVYFVQTPYKYFIIESHSWLPGIIVFLPRTILFKVLEMFGKFWPKKTHPDWNLLTKKDMKELFPDALIVSEKSLLMTKSLIAIKTSG